ncbi:hypothetical protein NPJ88_017360, partial [Halomonas elongata]|uniref:hypothetical protein n=1 Tax=Halomonas elongata TaxID=2746 RepID=UPI00255B225F
MRDGLASADLPPFTGESVIQPGRMNMAPLPNTLWPAGSGYGKEKRSEGKNEPYMKKPRLRVKPGFSRDRCLTMTYSRMG